MRGLLTSPALNTDHFKQFNKVPEHFGFVERRPPAGVIVILSSDMGWDKVLAL